MQTLAWARQRGSERLVALRAALPLVSAESVREWAQLAKAGEWDGHPAGPFVFDGDVFAAIVRNFERQANPVPLTYGHDEAPGQPRPAAGWIHDLAVRGEDLWGLIEYTPSATKLIRGGEYRYCSVVVLFDSIDRETGDDIGPELLEVGLTNTPFIDGMKPLKASRRAALAKEAMMEMSAVEMVKAVLKSLPDDASVEQFMAVLEAEVAKQRAIASPPSGEGEPLHTGDPEDDVDASHEPAAGTTTVAAAAAPEAPPPAPEAEAGAADALVSALAEKLGLDVAGALALLRDKFDAVLELLGAVPASGEPASDASSLSDDVAAVANSRIAALSRDVAARDEHVKQLTDRVSALETEKLEARVDVAIREGRVLDADRDKMIRLARQAPDLLEEFLGAAKPQVQTKPVYAARTATSAGLATDEEEVALYDRALLTVCADPKKRREMAQAAIAKRRAKMNKTGRV